MVKLTLMFKYSIILLLVLFSSCGARKVYVVKTDTKITIDSTSIVKTDSVSTIQNNIVIDTQTQEIEVTPIDTCKEIIINNVSYKNARITIRNIKTKQVDTSLKKVSKTKEKEVKKSIVKKIEAKKKNIDKKESYISYLLGVLLIAFIFYLYNRFKKLLP